VEAESTKRRVSTHFRQLLTEFTDFFV